MEEWRKTRATKYILNYHKWKDNIDKGKSNKPCAGTAKYGIESSMPKGNSNGHSDPVFDQVARNLNATSENKYKRAVTIMDFVLNASQSKHKLILELWMNGMNIKQINEHTGYSNSSISEIRNKLLEMIDKKIND